MSKEIYQELQYAKWFTVALLAAWIGIPLIVGCIIMTFGISMPMHILICFCLHIIGIPLIILYFFRMQTSIGDNYIVVSRLLGLIKKKIRFDSIISYEVIDYDISDIFYRRYRYAGKNRIICYVAIDLKDIILGRRSKAVKLKTQEGDYDYLIGTQNPERIIEILRTRIGDKKRLQNP